MYPSPESLAFVLYAVAHFQGLKTYHSFHFMTQTEEELRWAFIGASDIAKTRMIKAINSQPNSRVVAVFSSNADRAKAWPARSLLPPGRMACGRSR